MAQTLEQRRRNAKFAKEQEARMGKSDDQIKKRVKETPKSPISPVWIGESPFFSRSRFPPVAHGSSSRTNMSRRIAPSVTPFP
ncbi:hypothetical protein MHUMG1_06952 [Metarhizium humberi]|uniref:Stress-associated endoplasmic reticulum protein n=1 Tax=Metarhizium humberi TaxID=2596975 RepID=A0A9P8S6D7_9HYPO|nr:hypothetical protein MHUMG1_06952 [Metarhizium humberi]